MKYINGILTEYIRLSRANAAIASNLENKNQEFLALLENLDKETQSLYMEHLNEQSDYDEALNMMNNSLPISTIIIVLLNVALAFLSPAYSLGNIILSIIVYFLIVSKQIINAVRIIKKYRHDDETLNENKSSFITSLKELKEVIKTLDDEQKKNATKMEDLKERFISLLKTKMDDAYKSEGIDVPFDFEEATVQFNTNRSLALRYNRGEEDE